MVSQDGEWGRKGATLSDKTARAEFGLTQDEIVAAVHAGELQYRLSSMQGNPWLRLLGGFRLVVFVGSFDELAVDERGAGADERDQVWGVDRAPAVLGGLDELERHRQSGGP